MAKDDAVDVAQKQSIASKKEREAAQERAKKFTSINVDSKILDNFLKSQAKLAIVEAKAAEAKEKLDALALKKLNKTATSDETKELRTLNKTFKKMTLEIAQQKRANASMNVSEEDIEDLTKDIIRLKNLQEQHEKDLKTAKATRNTEEIARIKTAMAEVEKGKRKAEERVASFERQKAGGITGLAEYGKKTGKELAMGALENASPVAAELLQRYIDMKNRQEIQRQEGKKVTGIGTGISNAVDVHTGGLISAWKGSKDSKLSTANAEISKDSSSEIDPNIMTAIKAAEQSAVKELEQLRKEGKISDDVLAEIKAGILEEVRNTDNIKKLLAEQSEIQRDAAEEAKSRGKRLESTKRETKAKIEKATSTQPTPAIVPTPAKEEPSLLDRIKDNLGGKALDAAKRFALPALGVAAAGAAGYGIGTLINKGWEETHDGNTIGGSLFDTLNPQDPNRNITYLDPVKMEAAKKRREAAAEIAKAPKEVAKAPEVQPQTSEQLEKAEMAKLMEASGSKSIIERREQPSSVAAKIEETKSEIDRKAAEKTTSTTSQEPVIVNVPTPVPVTIAVPKTSRNQENSFSRLTNTQFVSAFR